VKHLAAIFHGFRVQVLIIAMSSELIGIAADCDVSQPGNILKPAPSNERSQDDTSRGIYEL
jgi:hypothetical protein